jgi:hypothetical protein
MLNRRQTGIETTRAHHQYKYTLNAMSTPSMPQLNNNASPASSCDYTPVFSPSPAPPLSLPPKTMPQAVPKSVCTSNLPGSLPNINRRRTDQSLHPLLRLQLHIPSSILPRPPRRLRQPTRLRRDLVRRPRPSTGSPRPHHRRRLWYRSRRRHRLPARRRSGRHKLPPRRRG